jgi:hypothetical protein
VSGGGPGALGPADDGLHPGATEDRSWTETAWFAAAAPERGLAIWTYPLFRPELGVMSCGIYVWEPGAEELWQLPYYRTWWHLPIPDGLDLRRFTLPNGLSYECLEPLTAYRITYADGDAIELDVTFRALHAAHAVGVQEGGRGHLDQLGRVTGELTLAGERIAIDCVEMRDRTWSPRRESRQRAFLTYSYGADAGGNGFHVSTRRNPESGRNELLTGFALRGGVAHELAEGTCEIGRDAQGRPERIDVEAGGRDGAAVRARGEVVSRLSMPSTPWFVWACVVRWTLPDGTQVFGEHQDTWAPAALREQVRAAGAAAPRSAAPTSPATS